MFRSVFRGSSPFPRASRAWFRSSGWGLRRMTTQLHKLLEQAIARIRGNEPAAAQHLLNEALREQPDSPALLQPLAVSLHMLGRLPEAIDVLRRLRSLCPADAGILNNLGSALGASGDAAAAAEALAGACELAPGRADYWHNLARAHEANHDPAAAIGAIFQVLHLSPEDRHARLWRADLLKAVGELQLAEADLRQVIEQDPASVAAWARLVQLGTGHQTHDDLRHIQSLYQHAPLSESERTSLGFALGQMLERLERYDEAFAIFEASNAAKKMRLQWDPQAFADRVRAMKEACRKPLARAIDPSLGREAILIFGMPRSGSTLLEQVLSEHPQVEGGGEIGDLSIVLAEESDRRGCALEQWVQAATPADWTRMGQSYLDRTARWRKSRPYFTDKELSKWTLIGAARAMLPGAKLIHCRRDPVEVCWSCFKHEFMRDMEFSYSLGDLAAYARDEADLVDFWHQCFPGEIYEYQYERLVVDVEAEIRAVLSFCGLPFDPAVLQFHASERPVFTASAAQVRKKIQVSTSATDAYGTLLEPLRRAVTASGDGYCLDSATGHIPLDT